MRQMLPDVLELTRSDRRGATPTPRGFTTACPAGELRALRRRPCRAGILVGLACLLVAPQVRAGKPLNTIAKLQVSERGSQTVVRLQGNRRPVFSVFKLESPPRLTIDISNCRLSGLSSLVDVDTWAVSQIGATQFRTDASTVARVMVNFRRPAHYDVKIAGKDLVVTVTPQQPRPPRAAPDAVLTEQLVQARKAVASAKGAADEARTSAARAREDAAAERRAATSAKAAAVRARNEAEAARTEAQRQRTLVAEQAQKIQQVRRELERHNQLASAAKKQAEQYQQQLQAGEQLVGRLRADVQRARRELSKQPKLVRLQVAVKKAEARARQAQQEREQVGRLLSQAQQRASTAEQARSRAEAERARAEQLRVTAERARREADAARRAADEQRQAAERARTLAEARQRDEAQRRREAEAARASADDRARSLTRAIAEVEEQRSRLARAADTARRLQGTLHNVQRRERQQQQQVQQAQQNLEQQRQVVAESLAARKQLQAAVDSSRQLRQRMQARIDALQQEVGAQRRIAEAAQRAAVKLQRDAEQARQRMAAERGGDARRRAQQELREAEQRLAVVEQNRKRAERDRARLQAALGTVDRERQAEAQKLVQLRGRLAAAARRLPALEAQVASASRELVDTRRRLEQVASQRQREENRRQAAEQARERADRRLQEVEQQRVLAEKKKRAAEQALATTREALRAARSARESVLTSLKETRHRVASARATRAKEELELSKLRKQRSRGESEARARNERQDELEQRRAKLAELAAAGRREQDSARTAPKGKLARIRDLRFVDRGAEVRVELDVEGEVDHRLLQDGDRPLLSLHGARLPRSLQRTLDTSELDGPVEKVSSFVVDRRRGTVHVRADVSGTPRHRVERRGSKIAWIFDKPRPARQARYGDQRWATARDASKSKTYDYNPVKVAAARGAGVRLRRKRYTGRRIDLDFKDADIHNILRLLSDVGRVNIITSDVVRGTVTIRMKDVPWDHGLDVILRAKGLGMVREGNLLRVAPISDLEKEREAELARQKQVVLLQPLETRLIPLSYAQASDVLAKLQYTLSPRGKLTFDARTNMVIARDIAANLSLVEQMIRNLDTQTPQVLIEARIVEARTNYSKQLGIQWGGAFTATAANGNSTGLVFPNEIGIGGGTDDAAAPTAGILLGQDANPNFLVNMPASTGLNSGAALGLALGSLSGAFNVALRLSAAEATGDIRIISSPRITTLDNVEAKISQGVTIPFAQVSANGVQTTFKDAKLDLMVRPHVTADGSVIMKIQITRNEPDFVNTGPRGDPTILTKEATTELLVKDGMTAVIGGIYTTRDGRSWNKVPWLAEIPILGWFFKNRRENSDREEVLVFITPRIINRAQSIGQ